MKTFLIKITQTITILSLLLTIFSCKSSYFSKSEWIYNLEAGIINNLNEFTEGDEEKFIYDFSNEDYLVLKDKYKIDEIAGSGSEFSKTLNLMNNFSKKLAHTPELDKNAGKSGLDYLEYALEKNYSINCKAKAQILNDMCLALNIYSRKVWLLPESKFDDECHVVNEIFDNEKEKWIMVDITNNSYFVDENRVPLSVLEIREKIANGEFVTPVKPNDKLNNLESSLNKNYDNFLYIMKNLAFIGSYSIQAETDQGVFYTLIPVNLSGLDYSPCSITTFTQSPY